MTIAENDSDFVKELKTELFKQMNEYFYKYNMTEENAALIISTIVDPKFKKLSFLDEDADPNKYYKFAAKQIGKKFAIIPTVNAEISQKKVTKENFLSDDEYDSDSKTKTTLQEIKKYISHPKMSASKFFEEYGKTFQRLQVAAQFYLISPATSVPVERIFSHASFQVL